MKSLKKENEELKQKIDNIVDDKYSAEKDLRKAKRKIINLENENKQLNQEIKQLNELKTK